MRRISRKKFRSYQTLVLILLLSALLLAGCGKKSPPADTAKINFLMPDTYEDLNIVQIYYIPAGKTVKFYTVSEAIKDGSTPITADHFFTGTTKAGGGKITCPLPNSLLNKERYIIAIVVLEGDYDLNGKSPYQVMEDASHKKILFADSQDESGPKLYTLTDGITITDFKFQGIGEDEPAPEEPEEPTNEIMVIFNIPDEYVDITNKDDTYPMPGGVIDFYLTDIEEEGAPIDPQAYVTRGYAPPGGEPVECNLPEELNGKYLKIHALVCLEETDLDLRGKTFDNFLPVIREGKALYGRTDGRQEITDGSVITGLKFFGVPAP